MSRRIRNWQDALQGPSLSLFLGMEIVFIFMIVPLVETQVVGRVWITAFQSLLALVSVFVVSVFVVSVFVVAGIGLTRLVIGLGFALTLATAWADTFF